MVERSRIGSEFYDFLLDQDIGKCITFHFVSIFMAAIKLDVGRIFFIQVNLLFTFGKMLSALSAAASVGGDKNARFRALGRVTSNRGFLA